MGPGKNIVQRPPHFARGPRPTEKQIGYIKLLYGKLGIAGDCMKLPETIGAASDLIRELEFDVIRANADQEGDFNHDF